VHETWFYREPAAFEVLVNAARQSGRRYRVLSLPCSTGEEAYSIAIALQGLPCEIVALDISAQAISRARNAAFGSSSFRGRSPAWRDEHFHFDGRHWRPRRSLTDAVRFEVGNLLAPPSSLGTEPFDAVFCRNLLIYLDARARSQAYATLRRLTREGSGLIFVGHGESAGAFDGDLQRVDHPMSFAFHNRAVCSRPQPAAVRAVPARRPATRTVAPVVPWALPAPLLSPSRRQPVATPANPLQAVRDLADRGELGAALQACTALLQREPASADGHALLGMLLAATGNAAQASTQFAKALYLDPQQRDSLSYLLLLAEQSGDRAQAQLLRERMRRGAVTA
jgi:chemotaxis protein methyltransferase WspC